jgi:multiple sugar transport system ATP-binding protein
MIYVTHDQVEAMTLATRIVVMRNGKIQQIGAPADVYEKPENLFVAGFLGSPGMNLLTGKLGLSSSGKSVFLCGKLALDVSSCPLTNVLKQEKEVTLGIRPENLLIHAGGEWQGTVSVIEPMGNHHVVWVDFGGTLLSSVVTGDLAFCVDEVVRFSIDVAKISLFDKTTEQRL